MIRAICAVLLISVVGVVESSCRKRHVAVPSPPAPARLPPQEPAPTVPRTEPIPPPPDLPPPEATPNVSLPPSTPPGAPPAARPSRRSAGRTTPPAAQPAPSAPVTAPVPQLGPVLTADQQREFNLAIDQSLGHTEASLRAISSHRLSREQQARLGEIQSFVKQAQATRGTDLPGARRLAERAEVLAESLERNLR